MKVGDLGVFNNSTDWTIIDLVGRMFVITELMVQEHAIRVRMLDDFEEILFELFIKPRILSVSKNVLASC